MAVRIIPARTVTVTLEDIILDQLCFEHAYSALRDRVQAGKLTGYVEATLLANPGIAKQTFLPLGMIVQLPEFSIQTETSIKRLWD